MSYVYLDNNASTLPLPEVIDAVYTANRDMFANASSSHSLGIQAAEAISVARTAVQNLLQSEMSSLIFTSGATEANNLAIRGLWEATRNTSPNRANIIIGTTEHVSVSESALALEKTGALVIQTPVDSCGIICLDTLTSFVNSNTLLVSIMAANSETGTLAPIKQIVQICKAVGAYVHCDATQYVGRLPLCVEALGLDLVSFSGHKMHGPKGVGALAVARGTPIAPQSLGGGHERGLRAGTMNTPAIVGFGVAASLAASRFAESMAVQNLRDQLHANLSKKLEGVTLNGHPTDRLPNTLNLRFEGADAEAVMASLRRVACSAGSACHGGSQAPSHVLMAMGLSPQEAHESLRFSLSRDTTKQEIDHATDDIVSAVNYVRSLS